MKLYRHMDYQDLCLLDGELIVLPRRWAGSKDSTIEAGIKSFWHTGYFPVYSSLIVSADFQPEEKGIMSYTEHDAYTDEWRSCTLLEYTTSHLVRIKIEKVFVPECYIDFCTGAYYERDIKAADCLQTRAFLSSIEDSTELCLSPTLREVHGATHMRTLREWE